MKRLFIALTLLLYAGLNAQTFDFTCETAPAQGQWSHVAGDFTIGNLVYNTKVIGDEYDYEYNIIFAHPPGRYRGKNPGGIHFTPREGEAFEDGDYIIAKNANTVEGDIIFIGRINGTPLSNPGSWNVDPIQDTEEGAIYASEGPITIGKIADPTHRAWTHTPGDVEVDGDGVTTTYNTTVIGDEFTMPYEAGRASNNYPSGTLVWSNSDPVYLGTGEALGVSNGSYFIVKYGPDKYLIIQGYQITGNGRIGVQRIVYNTGGTTDISVFNTFAEQGDHFTVGRIATPTVVDADFVHTPGTFKVDGYEYNTATTVADEERFIREVVLGVVSTDVGNWWRYYNPDSQSYTNGVVFITANRDRYPVGSYIVLKQRDVTNVEDVYLGRVLFNANSGQVRVTPEHLPSSWTLSTDTPIQIGAIADPTPPYTYGHEGEAEYQAGDYVFDTRLSATDQFDLGYEASPQPTNPFEFDFLLNKWNTGTINAGELWVDENRLWRDDDYIIIKHAENNVTIAKLYGRGKALQSNLDRFHFSIVHGSFDPDVETGTITVAKIADPIDFLVNLRVEIAQPYASNYSAVEDVTIRDDADSLDDVTSDGNNQRILMTRETDLGGAHFFQETHPISWFDDATKIDLWPRTDATCGCLDPETKATKTEFTFSPPASPVDGETYTYKFFARDGGYDIANAHLRDLDFHFELDPSQNIAGATGRITGTSGNVNSQRLIIGLDASTDLLSEGDRVIVSSGDLLSIGEVYSVLFTTTLTVVVTDGHSRDFHYDNRTASTKVYKLK